MTKLKAKKKKERDLAWTFTGLWVFKNVQTSTFFCPEPLSWVPQPSAKLTKEGWGEEGSKCCRPGCNGGHREEETGAKGPPNSNGEKFCDATQGTFSPQTPKIFLPQVGEGHFTIIRTNSNSAITWPQDQSQQVTKGHTSRAIESLCTISFLMCRSRVCLIAPTWEQPQCPNGSAFTPVKHLIIFPILNLVIARTQAY